MSSYVRYGLIVLGVGVLALIVRVGLAGLTAHAPELFGGTFEPAVATTSLAAGSAFANAGYVDQTGMIVMDASAGYPAVPFLQYATADHGVAMKQLVYPWSRPCDPYAGDLPCVDVDEAAAYPQIPQGKLVRVQGMLKDDRILVYQVTPLQ